MTRQVHALGADLAGNCDQRGAIGIGVGDTRHEVGGSGAERRKADSRLARQAAVDIGHERGSLFVADRDELDRRLPDRFHQFQGLFAGNSKNILDAFAFEGLD